MHPRRLLAFLLAPALALVAGCGSRVAAFSSLSDKPLAIQTSVTRIDTSSSVRLSALTPAGDVIPVRWSVSGGDPHAGFGTISTEGRYSPPTYLTTDSATVTVSALPSPASGLPAATQTLTIYPAFLRPLTPGNLALGPGGSVTVSAAIAEVGGSGSVHFSLATDRTGTPANPVTSGTLGIPHCSRSPISSAVPAYTTCSISYTAPAAVAASTQLFLIGAIQADNAAVAGPSWTRILLNPEGISSNPATHQAHLAVPVSLGSSSGNATDYDSANGQLADCCGGTLGALLEDQAGNQFVLSNNHVLARTDQSLAGETIIQPGLIDNGCRPLGVNSGLNPVATLTGYPALSSRSTNTDAAIARVTPGLVDPHGNILELGARQPDGTLAPAPPGITASGGHGEIPALGMTVAKSGRTTGLTCSQVSALHVDVTVDYYTDCAETARSMAKTFTDQIAVAGTGFTDAGDSGSLIVDSTNAEPVALFFAGGTDSHGVEQSIATPAPDVLAALDRQVPGASGPASYTFVGGADHSVSCLRYGDRTAAPVAATLTSEARQRAGASLPLAQSLAQAIIVPGSGFLRAAPAAGKDHPDQAAIAFYLDPAAKALPSIPASLAGIPTMLIQSSRPSDTEVSAPPERSLALALAAKQKHAASLISPGSAIFGVGVGASLDNPAEAAVVLFVDRQKPHPDLPTLLDGQRVKVILMDRLHVTRAHGTPADAAHPGCLGQVPSDSDYTLPEALPLQP